MKSLSYKIGEMGQTYPNKENENTNSSVFKVLIRESEWVLPLNQKVQF